MKIDTAVTKQGLRKNEFDFNVDQKRDEKKISANQLDLAGEEIIDRQFAVDERTNSPFAGTAVIDRELKKKIAIIKNRKQDRETKYKAELEKIKGEDAIPVEIRAEIDRQYQQANSQDKQEEETINKEYSLSKADRERNRRGFEFSQNSNINKGNLGYYAAQTQAQKFKGEDTRNEDYVLAVRNKQQEYSEKRFDLEQQKSQITAVGEAADAQREKIDAMIANLERTTKLDLSNLATQFDRFNEVLGETQKATRDVLGQFVTTGKFDWKKILRTPFESITNQALNQVVPNLFSGLYRQPPKVESVYGPQLPATGAGKNQGKSIGETILGLIGGAFGYAEGGVIGTGRGKADDQLILAQRGEGIITHKGMDVLGSRGLQSLNLGKLPQFATGGLVGELRPISMSLDQSRIDSSSSSSATINIEGIAMM